MRAQDVRSATTATVEVIPQFAMDGREVALVIIKQKFVVDRRMRVTRVNGAEVKLVDEPWGEEAPSNLKVASDICLHKPGTDVLVEGEAMTRGRASVKTLDVLVRVGPAEKIVRVFGKRVWYKGLAGLTMTSPEPFESVPLRWDLAYGGFDDSDKERPPLEEPRNPVGRGVARDSSKLVHQEGPQIEDPRDLISSHRSHPAPAGVGPIGRHWEPRRRYVGTMDEQWMKERMPLPPVDFDDRFNQCATPELIIPQHLRGGEQVQIHNMHEAGALQFELPRIHFFVGVRTTRGLTEHRTVLDTVALSPTAGSFDLVWRSVVPVHRPEWEIRYIQVHEKVLR